MRRSAHNASPAGWVWVGSACLLALLAACNDPSPFEGAWLIDSGSITLVCDGGTFTQAETGTLVSVVDTGRLTVGIDGVTEGFTIQGNTATGFPMQFVVLPDDAGFLSSTVLTLTSDTLTVDASTLSGTARGSESTTVISEPRETCSFTRTLTATREGE